MGRVLVQQPGTNTAKALTETLPKNVIIVDEDLKELRLHDGVTPGGKLIGQSAGSGVPIGTIIPFAGNSVPQGYLLCDGSAISRTDYASLFAVIGTIYGAGDGNSTFKLPDLYDKLPMMNGSSHTGGGLGTIFPGSVPKITGYIHATERSQGSDIAGGAFRATQDWYWSFGGGSVGINDKIYDIDSSRSSFIYGNGGYPDVVIPRSITMRFLIKYI